MHMRNCVARMAKEQYGQYGQYGHRRRSSACAFATGELGGWRMRPCIVRALLYVYMCVFLRARA